METAERTRILDQWEVEHKIRRIAHQILEENYKEKSIVMVGVTGVGADVARELHKEFTSISDIESVFYELTLQKDKPLQGEMTFSGELKDLRNKVVFLVDDVLNSGRTLIFAARHLLGASPKSLRTVVLVDRIHRKFPIRADYVGMTLSTNLKEHVAVEKEGKGFVAYLD